LHSFHNFLFREARRLAERGEKRERERERERELVFPVEGAAAVQ
jgi:hypothetical protein